MATQPVPTGSAPSAPAPGAPKGNPGLSEGSPRSGPTPADTTQREVFKSSIELLARDRGLLLAEVSITLNNMHVPLHALQARELKDGMTSVTLTLGTVNVEQLTNIMSNLRKIDGVVEVKRANQ